MSRYVIGRVVQMFPVLFGVILAVFALTHILPGDPVLLLLDVQYTEAQYKEMQANLGLDRPIYVQFFNYVWKVVQGDFGQSARTGIPVSDLLFRRFPATFVLSVTALFFSSLTAIPIGIISALKQKTKVDYLSMIGSQIGISAPIFWLGLMSILVFSLHLDLLPPGGRGEPPDLAHLVLPALCLSLPFMAMTARLTRSCMLEVLRENYIVAARSRGYGEFRIILKHALRNAMIPVVTNLGLQLSRLLGGAVVTEVVFRWPGIGGLAYDAIMERDYPVVMGVVILSAAIFIVINLLVDISYSFFDPRIRYDTKSG